jgi:hypothetical protein
VNKHVENFTTLCPDVGSIPASSTKTHNFSNIQNLLQMNTNESTVKNNVFDLLQDAAREILQERVEACMVIQTTFPPDSPDANKQAIAQNLLSRAFSNAYPDWRDLPTKVLKELARLCTQQEIEEYKDFAREAENY